MVLVLGKKLSQSFTGNLQDLIFISRDGRYFIRGDIL